MTSGRLGTNALYGEVLPCILITSTREATIDHDNESSFTINARITSYSPIGAETSVGITDMTTFDERYMYYLACSSRCQLESL